MENMSLGGIDPTMDHLFQTYVEESPVDATAGERAGEKWPSVVPRKKAAAPKAAHC